MITNKQKDDMLHAIGRIKIRKNWKPQTILDKAYRNRFITYSPDESWEALVKQGLAGREYQKNGDGSDIFLYYVTIKGIEAIKEVGLSNGDEKYGKRC